ncbi:EamA family transporter [Rhodobacterales bacterium HKCCE3408]|nr:EamA family transporter [Rhodobacterales bacterium HKCCE3408]
MTPNTRGALFMIGSMCAFTFNDALMKMLSGNLPLAQAVFLRGVVTSLLILALIRARRLPLRPRLDGRDRWFLILRSAAEVGAAYFFLTALFNMPIANASAILQALPLSVTLAGALFLGQPVGWRRLSAITVGFAGVMLIVRPGLEGFTVFSLYALASVVCVTARDILSRMISATVPTLTVALVNAVWVGGAFGIASLFTDWQPLDPVTAVTLCGASVFLVGGYFFAVAAMRSGEIAVVAPFRYTSLLAAMILGIVLFSEVPDTLTLAGAAIVVATGLYTFWRERKLA